MVDDDDDDDDDEPVIRAPAGLIGHHVPPKLLMPLPLATPEPVSPE